MPADVVELRAPLRTSLHDRSSSAGAQAWLARLAGVESFDQTRLRASLEFALSEPLESVSGAANSAAQQLQRISQQLVILARTVALLPWGEALPGVESNSGESLALLHDRFELLTQSGVERLRERVDNAAWMVGGAFLPPHFELLSVLEEWTHGHGFELTGVVVAMVEIALSLSSPVKTSAELDSRGRAWRKEIDAYRDSPERAEMLAAERD